jgi:hypothetical protein
VVIISLFVSSLTLIGGAFAPRGLKQTGQMWAVRGNPLQREDISIGRMNAL